MADRNGLYILCAGAALGASATYFYLSRTKNPQNQVLDQNGCTPHVQLESIPQRPLPSPPPPPPSSKQLNMAEDFDKDPVLAEQLTRNVQFFGLDGQKKVVNSFVVVVGLGGVGSHCAHLLLRSGVGHLRLVDFDQVTLSSLNRHCLATRADVGLPKATCLKQHFTEILPEAKVEALCEMYTDTNEELILSGNPDFVVDAIDNIDTKVALLAACHRRGIPVLCSAGAGAKADPTRLTIVDLAQSTVDPLARSVRYRLRRDYAIEKNIPVLLSTEKPRCGLVYCGDDGVDMTEYQVIPNFRIRTIPVLGTTPAVFGMAAAGYVLCALAQAPIHPSPLHRIPAKAVQTQFDRLEERESDRFGAKAEEVGVDVQEVEVLLREVWRGGSARATSLPADDQALTRGLGDLVLTRWRPEKGSVVDNLVLLTRGEADAHDQEVATPQGFAALRERDPAFVDKVERALARARREFTHSYYC